MSFVYKLFVVNYVSDKMNLLQVINNWETGTDDGAIWKESYIAFQQYIDSNDVSLNIILI